jgi:type VI secretion system secreted protein VgrG
MSLTDTLKNTLSALTEGGLNRYRLDIPSCTALLDVETFSGKEFMSELYLPGYLYQQRSKYQFSATAD